MSALPDAPPSPLDRARALGSEGDFHAVLNARDRLVARVQRAGGTIADGLTAIDPHAAELALIELQHRRGADEETIAQILPSILSGLALGVEVLDSTLGRKIRAALEHSARCEMEHLARAFEALEAIDTEATVEARRLIDERGKGQLIDYGLLVMLATEEAARLAGEDEQSGTRRAETGAVDYAAARVQAASMCRAAQQILHG